MMSQECGDDAIVAALRWFTISVLQFISRMQMYIPHYRLLELLQAGLMLVVATWIYCGLDVAEEYVTEVSFLRDPTEVQRRFRRKLLKLIVQRIPEVRILRLWLTCSIFVCISVFASSWAFSVNIPSDSYIVYFVEYCLSWIGIPLRYVASLLSFVLLFPAFFVGFQNACVAFDFSVKNPLGFARELGRLGKKRRNRRFPLIQIDR